MTNRFIRVPQTITLSLIVRELAHKRSQEIGIPFSRYVENLIIEDLGGPNVLEPATD